MTNSRSNHAVHRLCTVIHRCLHPFTELKKISSTPENGKKLLISLSQILREIRRLIDDHDTELQEQSSICSSFESHSAEHECLVNIVSSLVSLLNTDDKYAQHLLGNIFLVISEFLLACGDSWDKLVHLLCVSFEFGLRNVLQPSFNGVEDSKCIPANLGLILNDFTWNGVAGIIRVLRGILKHLKEEEDAELVVVVSDLLSTSLSEIPWDVLNGVQNDTSTDVRASSNDGDIEVKTLLVGNLVQLLCSLVGLIGSAEVEAGSIDKNTILHKICDLVPNLVRWCLAEDRSFIHSRIRGYFQHKFLMLMIRLSFHMKLDCSVLLLWLKLLHEYFQDLLSRPLSVVQCGQDDALEGSPFISSLHDEEICHLSLCHLQRQTVFLFVRCCVSLIGPRYPSDLTIAGKRKSSLFDSNSSIIDNNFGTNKGLCEFYEWLQGKVPLDIFSKNQMYLEKCNEFTTSFITLYMREDDMLFEVLLQMLSLSSWAETMLSKDGRSFDNEEDILFHISNLFNPLLVFLVFLAELQYDHQLLLDYLISKDTGSKCAEYLLRCLRTICASWDQFLQLLVGKTRLCQNDCQKSCKRTRTFLEDSCAEQIPVPLHCGHAVSFEQNEKEFQPGSKVFRNCSIRIQDAKACLRSLKNALKKLHQKKLFPYNPEVLIRWYDALGIWYL
ncbi:hypothetical protein RND81_06G030400 [Saponaria officinalis]|uniref:Protein Lines C-terminal domain-containing protein n=1 Tax=Saponaria officinalis TaxID=3572 RepID=A0AAW1K798_SAPOF